MFRIRDPQESLWQSQFLVTPKKAKRLERSWAEVFRNEALPLIDEERFAPMYCVDNGRPNRAVQTVLGVHLLKEMFNLTDQEALEQLEFNLLWHHALRLDIEETHLPQKTLHNFRVRLMQHDGGRLAFQETTDRIIQALGIRTGKQRLDSTHIMSNIATLTRLGLFCETMRLFLRALRWEHPELRPGVPEGLLGRYLKEEDEATHYEDARTGEGRRRLSVCARDLYRLVDRFHGTTAAQLEEYRLLERLLREQCHVGKHQDGRPRDDDDDAGECKVPVALKDPKQVSADSLQSPHDPDVTYSGHKGKGYEVQVAETCHEENATQLITHVEVTPSSGSDTDVSVPVVDGLAERKVRPDELFADTAYGSGRNAFEASRRGTELVSPVAGSAPGNSHEGEGDGPPPLTAADFQIDVTGEQATVCPAGHPSIEEYELKDAPERVEVHFAGTTCEPCPLRSRCPVKLDRGVRGPTSSRRRPGEGEHRAAPEGRGHRGVPQRDHACPERSRWRKRYLAIRAGIEVGERGLRAASAPTGLGACGCEGAVGCRPRLAGEALEQLGVGALQLQAEENLPRSMHAWWRWLSRTRPSRRDGWSATSSGTAGSTQSFALGFRRAVAAAMRAPLRLEEYRLLVGCCGSSMWALPPGAPDATEGAWQRGSRVT